MKNERVKLTNVLVNSYQSNTFTAEGKTGKIYFIHEETAPGLSLKVNATWKDKHGIEKPGSKTWIFRYRSRGEISKVRDWKIGRASDITLEKVKNQVSIIKVNLAKGIEPSIEKKRKEKEEVLGELIKKYYNAHLTISNGFRENTITNIKDSFKVWVFRKTKDVTCIKRFIERDISKLKISQINSDLIKEIHKSIGSSGATYSANRFVSYLKMFFSWAIEKKYFDKENPCKIKKKFLFPEKKYNGRLSGEERERVYDNAILIDQRTGRLNYNQYHEKSLSPVSCMMVAFQLATGRRTKSEVGSVQWSMINFSNKEITYNQTKTSKKNGIYNFPLGPKAIEILQLIQRDRLNNEESNFYYPIGDIRTQYVFPAKTYGRKVGSGNICQVPYIQEVRTTWKKLLNLSGVNRHLKNYATRHTVGSIVIEQTSDPNAVAEILGVTVETALGYAKSSRGKIRRILEEIDSQKIREPLKAVN